MSGHLTQAYVFAQSPIGESVLTGTLTLEQSTGTFRYSDFWLQQPWSYPLDPINLKLQEGEVVTRRVNKVLPVFSDAGPDDWGTKVLLAGHSRLPANELERLVATSGHGVGCLQFSLSRSRPKTPSSLPTLELLSDLEEASRRIEQNQRVDPALLAILLPATSLGGARPKVTLQDEGQEYLAKFSKPGDFLNMPAVEFATMSLARQCGIRVPEIRLSRTAERQVFIVERFDRMESRHLHYISAHSLFNREKVRIHNDAFADPCSYIALARILRLHARDWQADSAELFRRIVFNVYVGNTDDHGRNHGLLYDPANPGWMLSQAFDIVPSLDQGREHSLGIGAQGRLRSLENVRSAASGFGLSDPDANDIIDEVLDTSSSWQRLFADAGVSQRDIDLLKHVMGNI